MRITSALRCAFAMLSFAVLANAQAPAVPPLGSLTIRAEGRTTVLSPDDLQALPRHEHRVAADGSPDSAVVSGVALWDVLQKAGVPPAARWIRGLVAISISALSP